MRERIRLINIILTPLIVMLCKHIGIEDRFKEYKDNLDIR